MFSVICPEQYHQAFFSEGLRADGRTFSEARPAFTMSRVCLSEYESHIVRRGNSIVYINVTPQVTTPTTPGAGFLGVKVLFYPYSSEACSFNEQSTRYSHMLHSALYPILQHFILSIDKKGTDAVWAVYLEVLVLVEDGSIFDLILDASVAILKSFHLPIVTISQLEDGAVVIRKSGDVSKIPLVAPNTDLSSKTTMAVPINRTETTVNSPFLENIILVDPTRSEELLPNRSEIVTHSISGATEHPRRLLNISKRYGPALPWNLLHSAIK